MFPINTLSKMDRGYIGKEGTDVWGFSCSVQSYSVLAEDIDKKRPKEITGYCWAANMWVQVNGTRINLHEPHSDYGLVKMEEKLKLLSTKLRTYVSTMRERYKKKADKIYVDRTWLNLEEWETDYTGYVSCFISDDGDSRVGVADCYKTICIWIGPPDDGDDRTAVTFNRLTEIGTKNVLAIAAAAEKALDQIHLLRIKFNQVLDESKQISK